MVRVQLGEQTKPPYLLGSTGVFLLQKVIEYTHPVHEPVQKTHEKGHFRNVLRLTSLNFAVLRDFAAHILSMETITFLETTEVAELLKISPRTIEGWRNDGTGPTFRKVGRVVRYERSDVIDWVRRG